MIRTNFYLRSPLSQKPTAIILVAVHKGKRIRLSTGLEVLPYLWDSETQRPTSSKHKRNEGKKLSGIFNLNVTLNEIADHLDGIEKKVSQYYNRQIEDTQQIDFRELKLILVEHLQFSRNTSETSSPFLTEYFQHFIEQMEQGKVLTPSDKKYAHGTIKGYKVTLQILFRYERERNIKLRTGKLSVEDVQKVKVFCQSLNHSGNTIGRTVKQIKVVCKHAFDAGLTDNEAFTKFSVYQQNADTIALTFNEIDALYRLPLIGQQAIYRDVFLVGCYTALRISDIFRIQPDNIVQVDGFREIHIISKKTGKKVEIPIRPELDAILRKYGYSVPNVQRQHVNTAIKEIAKLAGIDTIEQIKVNKGGKDIVQAVPRYKLISAHTGRRTGATLMHYSGMPSKDIMEITGHATLKAFENYIKFDKEGAKERKRNNPFFTGGTALKAV